ncbi:hypothetical protein [Bordetella genomosp. 2]|uniref:hypothetical protein n=1 Tax=Bordetella genomosp. 2 TaxID=1983456 RepID=UPI0011406A08|nr:hypothetical protein [Bordetella genomosp. 2]
MSIEFVFVQPKGRQFKITPEMVIGRTFHGSLIDNPHTYFFSNEVLGSHIYINSTTGNSFRTVPTFFFDGEVVFEKKHYKDIDIKSTKGYFDLSENGRGSFFIGGFFKAHDSEYFRATTDQLGLYPLFYYKNDRFNAVTNNPMLLESIMTEMYGHKMTRHLKHLVNEISVSAPLNVGPYKNLYYLPFDNELIIGPQGEFSFKRKKGDDYFYCAQESFDNLLDAAVSDICDNVSAIANASYPIKIADITGGMDSRMVFAAILKSNTKDAFYYNTNGSYPSPDANVSNFIIQKYNLRKIRVVDEFRRNLTSTDLTEELLAFSYASSGCKNNLDRAFTTLIRNDAVFRLGGGNSEFYKALYSKQLAPDATLDDAIKLMVTNLDILQQPVREEITSNFNQMLREWSINQGMTMPAALDRFYIEHRGRFHNGLCEHWGRVTGGKAHPLYSAATIRLGFSIDDRSRKEHLITFRLMTALDQEVACLPFENRVWPEAAYRGTSLTSRLKGVKSIVRTSPNLVKKEPEIHYFHIKYPREAPRPASRAEKVITHSDWKKSQLKLGRKWHWSELDKIQQQFQHLVEHVNLEKDGFNQEAVIELAYKKPEAFKNIFEVLSAHNLVLGLIFKNKQEKPIRIYAPTDTVRLVRVKQAA